MTPTPIPFVKMHGLGNDYVYLDEWELGSRVDFDQIKSWARPLADRHRGVGGDGLILLRRDEQAACRMEMFNADGSRAEMCGNGIRCVAWLAWSRGHTNGERAFGIATDSGLRDVEILEASSVPAVRVSMGIPEFEPDVEVTAHDRTFQCDVVSLGNPHCVISLSESPQDFPVEHYGPAIETHERFPNRINVEFVRVTGDSDIEFRVWERGSGETQACGTGATAAAAALHRRGKVNARSTVHLLGGDLEIEVDSSGMTWMTGTAETAFTGEFSLDLVD